MGASDFVLIARESRCLEVFEYPGFNLKRRLFLHKDLVVKQMFVMHKPREEYSGKKFAKSSSDPKRVGVDSWDELEVLVVFMNGLGKCFDFAEGGREVFSFDIQG